MPRIRLFLGTFQRNAWLLLPSAVLGASAGLFVYGYWLTGFLPIGDEQLLIAAAVLSLVAATGYLALLNWVHAKLQGQPPGRTVALMVVGAPIAAFLLFGGTSNWMSSGRYLGFLLPEHHLQITATPASSASGTALVWFNTSIGDVSYATVTAKGWTRVGDELVVSDPNSNGLSWVGKVGDRVQLVVSGSSPDSQIALAWDGQAETVPLARDKTNYSRAFSVPLYASETALLVLGCVALYGLTLALTILIWSNSAQLKSVVLQVAGNGAGAFRPLDAGLLAGIGLIAGLLRFSNLGSLYPAVDEYYHLIAAKQILQGAAITHVYPRGLWIVTLPIVLGFRFFGEQLWVARLIGACFNFLALIPLYLLARRINRPVAIIACALYATSPWITTFARVAREYAYYPFYFYWIIYGMVEFVARIPERFIFAQQWKLLLRPKMIALGIVLVIPPIFGLKIDWLSTFRAILIAYLVFGFFILLRFDWHARRNWPILGLLAAGVVVIARAWYLEQSGKLFVLPQVNMLPIEYFLPNPQQQWYFDRAAVVVALGILGTLVAAFWQRTLNFVPLFALALFAAYLAVFAFFSRSFFHTRHLLSTELWYVIVVAMALYAFWETLVLLIPRIPEGAQFALAGVIALGVVNVGQVLVPAVASNPDMPISEDYMHDMSRVQAFMLPQVHSTDVLISTVYGQYAIWMGAPSFADQLRITSHTPVDDILLYAAGHESGWIVMDDIRFKLSSISIKDLAGHEQIEYVGEFGDERVWHWDRTSSQSLRLAWAEGVR